MGFWTGVKNTVSYSVLAALLVSALLVGVILLYTYWHYVLAVTALVVLVVLFFQFVYLNRFKSNPHESTDAIVFKY